MGWFACRRGFPSPIRGNTWAIDLLARRVHLCRGLQRVSVQGDTVGPVRNHSHGVACGRREPISWPGGVWQEHRCRVMGARHPPLQSLVAHHASRRQATTQGAKPHTAGPAVCGEGQGGRRRPYHHWGGIRWARLAWRLPHLPISFLYGSAAIRQLRRWVLVTGGRRRDRKREGEREREGYVEREREGPRE